MPLAKTLRLAEDREDPETSRRQRRLEKDHQNICGAPTAPQRLRAADADDDECDRGQHVGAQVIMVGLGLQPPIWLKICTSVYSIASL